MTKIKILTTSEVAKVKGLTTRQVQRLAKAGLLPVYTTGARGTLMFRASDVRYMKTSIKDKYPARTTEG